ncbi:MAG: hypothetical protein KDK33_12770, partial [Leptospiraceae bacterium]|nr:hypothetical protein [Leptospiraceae bacterium]
MHHIDRMDPHTVVATGFRLANYVRLGLGILFTLSVLSALSMENLETYLIRGELIATGILIIIAILGIYLMRGNRTPGIYVRVGAVLDMTIVGVVMMAGSLDGLQAAFNLAIDRNLFSVYLIFLVSSALLGSASLTFWLSVYGSALFAISNFLFYRAGVGFGPADLPASHIVSLPG